jgi:outer membrane protein assembly factor BamB
MKRQMTGLVVVFFTSCAALWAADWPQWRGPNRDGLSQETGLLKEWPAGGPKLVWQLTDIGSGYSTPAVVGERLYVISNRGLEDESVLALSTSDGKEVWSTRIGKVGNPNQKPPYPGARSTPTVDGDRLYVLGSDGDLACLETATGKTAWQSNVRTTFDGKPGVWAYAESPLIDGDRIVCTPGGERATIVALNKKNGDPLWTCAVPEGDQAAYASIIVVEAGGVKQYVQLLQKGLVGVDAKTGKLLWRYNRTAQGSPANIPTPISQQALVYSATGKGGAATVRIQENNGALEAAELYYERALPTAIGGAVVVDGYLYGTSQGLTCADFKTGEVKWQNRSIGPSSLLFADGRLYLHGENGDVALVVASPESYQEKGQFTPPGLPKEPHGKAWAYPVVANGRLYIRDWNCLWCYDVAAK